MNDNDILKRIFDPVDIKTIIATVVKRNPGGNYELVDDLQKKVFAESDKTWAPGTRVIIQSGWIIAKSQTVNLIKTYEV